MMGKIFRKFGTKAKVINYDDTSGLYIYKILVCPTSVGYVSKEEILENEVVE